MRDINSESENRRLRDLYDFAILDTPPEESFDRITRLAKMTFQTPMAVVSMVDDDRQWFKSKIGVSPCETPQDISFCTHTIRLDEPLIVRDALEDPRFAANPLVTSEPHIRFYIGTPLHTPGGYNIGALCVMDTVPRDPSADQIRLLGDLGRLVVDELELRKLVCLDPLTGALSKRGLENALNRLNTAFGIGTTCVIMMDVDHFKRVNDTHGHEVGDRVLQNVIKACRVSLGPRAVIARVGGEEFAVILPSIPLFEGLVAAERVRTAVAALVTPTRGGSVSVTASLGVATMSSGVTDFQDALAAADKALYGAKAKGRDRVQAADAVLLKKKVA